MNNVVSCIKPLAYKHHVRQSAPLQSTYVIKHSGHAVDIVGTFSNRYPDLTVTDHFSRHMELFSLKGTSTKRIIDSLFKYFTCFVEPSFVLSNIFSQFISYVNNIFNENICITIFKVSNSHSQLILIPDKIDTSIKI